MINLALQGGGTHGAYTWGVLDCLLEDGRIGVEAISGTSDGAMNAVVMAEGLVAGDIDGARQALKDFWESESREGRNSPIQRSPINMFIGDWGLDNSPSYVWFDLMSRLVSPYDIIPLNINPLRDLLAAQVDFDRVHACDRLKLFVSATNVHTGRVRVFTDGEITVDAVMASACLPFLFQAVEIVGVPYWDGGYMGNPALFPFFNACASSDVLLVQINPIERRETPRTAREILNRVNEITINSSLMKEFRAIDFVSRLIDGGKLDPAHYKQVLLHEIDAGPEMKTLSASSKVNAEWQFLVYLHDLGRTAARRWLDSCYAHVGVKSTVDVHSLFD